MKFMNVMYSCVEFDVRVGDDDSDRQNRLRVPLQPTDSGETGDSGDCAES